jgi:hypothetical protein
MDNIFPKVASALVLMATALYAIPVYATNDAMNRAEDRQLTEQFTPDAQYRLSRREAFAAYQEALQGCRQGDKSDRSCMREANRQLQQDLGDAKQHSHGVASMGSNDTGGSMESARRSGAESSR